MFAKVFRWEPGGATLRRPIFSAMKSVPSGAKAIAVTVPRPLWYASTLKPAGVAPVAGDPTTSAAPARTAAEKMEKIFPEVLGCTMYHLSPPLQISVFGPVATGTVKPFRWRAILTVGSGW